MPVLNAYEGIQDRAWQIGANYSHAWDNITFWSDGTYSDNAEISDASGTIRGRLAEYLGLLRDNQQAIPNNFILHSGASVSIIIDNGIYYETV